MESEKLQWNEFQNIVSSAFEDLQNDGDLTDVTLVCEDGNHIEPTRSLCKLIVYL